MESEVRTGFVRQRRSLIVASLGLLLLQSAGLKLQKITFLGNEFQVQHVEFLSVALWIAYVYFLIRYYQHFHDLGDKGLNTAYKIRVNKAIGDWAYGKARREFLKKQTDKDKKYIFKQYERRNTLIDKHAAMVDIKVPVDSITEKSGTISVSGTVIEKTEYAKWFVVYRVRIQAIMHIALRTRLLTEYYLPFIVAGIPLLWWLFDISHWLTTA